MVESPLTTAPGAKAVGDRRSNRRHFIEEQKLAIVRETLGATVAAVARRHGIVTSVIFRWRVQFGFGKEEPARLATVRGAGTRKDGGAGVLVLRDLLPMPDGMTAIDLPDGRRVFAPADVDPDAVRRHVAGRETAR
jgi:hypothetical protein